MQFANISEAKAQLSALIEKMLAGEEVIIGKAGKPVARLVKYENNKIARQPGALRGKLEIAPDFFQVIDNQGFAFLSITSEHAYAVSDLPRHHRDPFDRMIIAQAKFEGLSVVTHDAAFKNYTISILEV
jgi:prevent-host-death family protein